MRSRLSPEQAVLWLRGDRQPFALVGEWLGQRAIIGSEPLAVMGDAGDPFSVAEAQPSCEGNDAAVGGGWVGWLGYGLGARVESLPPSPPAPVPQPTASWAFYDHVLVFDGERWWFEGLWSHERDRQLRERLAVWQARMEREPPPRSQPATLTAFVLCGNGAGGHLTAVVDCRERIAAGELFQANLCLRLEAEHDGDLTDLFARALPAAKPRFGALLDGVLSLSPERFLRRNGRCVETEPIKGTRERIGEQAQAASEELLGSGKDASEHVMIVDLMRNDLGRVCEYGSVEVSPPRAEPHAGVWHLVSTVRGRLREGIGDGALLRATFPPGSVTGAPKVQAMKTIAALEATRRELYTGAIGIVSPLAGLEMSVAIRTFEKRGRHLWFGAGGGIVAQSDPEPELSEALAKAAGPIDAIGGQLKRPGPTSWDARRLREVAEPALRYGARPDPAKGVFETVLVRRGRAETLQAHLNRLAHSLAELYGTELDPATAQRARDAATSCRFPLARLRVLARPDGCTTVETAPVDQAPGRPVRLVPFTLPGGLGAHKWRDRSLLEALYARVRGAVSLLVDTDGLVLEAGHANIWIVEGDSWLTPPADGRILAGLTRARILAEQPLARETQLDLARLEQAQAIFLTSAVSGRRPARLASKPSPPV